MTGISCLVCMWFQIPMSAFRCKPDSPSRWIFNLLHWTMGNAALLLGFVSIFLVGDLRAASFVAEEKHYRIIFVFVLAFLALHIFLIVQR